MNANILETLAQASLSGAVMILAVVILRLRFRSRTPQRVFCLLWDLVLLRLLLPVKIVSPFSIRWLLALPRFVPETTANTAVFSVVMEDFAVPQSGTWTAVQAAPVSRPDLLPLLWCAGAALCALWLLWGHLQSRSLYAMSLPVEDDFIRRWQALHPLRRYVQVRRSDRIPAPLTYGVLQPVVLLPSRMDLADRENLSYVLEHEYTHIRRFDTLRKCLLAAGLCLHWFNPLVWLMYVLANRDIELACDEAVVRSGADRQGYALALLRMEEERGGASLSGSHFSAHALEERIEAIMKNKKSSLTALLAILIVMCVTTTVFATSAPANTVVANSQVTAGSSPAIAPRIQLAANDALVISGEPDGEKYFSLDGGETWMDAESYHAQYGNDVDVEWWTYEEFKAWVEQEKINLAAGIGSRCYTPSKGWFTWDSATVRETLAMYEAILEHIGNGGLYSKTIQDKDGNTLDTAVLASGSAGILSASETSYTCASQVNYVQMDTAELLKSYQAFGVTGNEQDGLYYNGQLIRCLVDGYLSAGGGGACIRYSYTNDKGAVDVHTLREVIYYQGGSYDPFGPLTGMAVKGGEGYTPELFDCVLPDSAPQQTTAQGSGSTGGGRTLEQIFAGYAHWGLRYNAEAAKTEKLLTYMGRPVSYFVDQKPDGSVFTYDNPYAEDARWVRTVYDDNGNLTGLTTQLP